MSHIPAWLKNSVFYEIYPQSFKDSNGDGIGDFGGMIEKIGYVKSLGCDAIWLNPCFDSPFRDAGYDVRDFYKVAERYGTNDDLKAFIDKCHENGIRVILDLVAGHSSNECSWFLDSCKAQKNKYSNYYMWTKQWDAWDCGGYRAIHGYADREGSFIVNFFHSQPALNYGFYPVDEGQEQWQLPMDHPDALAVRDELRNIMKFYLDMGCDGFRVDMASSLVRGKKSYEGLQILWGDIRGWMETHYPEAVLVSEWSNPAKAINASFHVDFLVHFGLPGYTSVFRQEMERVPNSPYAGGGRRSYFDKDGQGDALLFVNEVIDQLSQMGGKGYMSIPTGNHDFGRIRQGRSLEELKVLYTALFAFPGVPFLYYGDEIGMDYVYGLVSKEGGYNRTGARTPMQWSKGPGAGFSTANEKDFYLPLGKEADTVSVEAQQDDPDSLLNYTRKLIKLRREHPALGAEGEFIPLYALKDTYPLVFERKLGDSRFVTAVNPSGKPASAEFGVPGMGAAEVVAAFGKVDLKLTSGGCVLDMDGISAVMYRL